MGRHCIDLDNDQVMDDTDANTDYMSESGSEDQGFKSIILYSQYYKSDLFDLALSALPPEPSTTIDFAGTYIHSSMLVAWPPCAAPFAHSCNSCLCS
jgi:hypothetical protein